MRVLVVREPFGDYAKGQVIKDADAVKAVQDGGFAHHCTPADHPESFFAEDPAPKAKG